MNSIANGNCIMPQQYLFNWNQVLPIEKHDASLKYEADAASISPQYRHKRTRNSSSFESSFVQVNVSKRVFEQQLRIFFQTSCSATVLEKMIIENSRMLSILKRKFKFQVALICTNLIDGLFIASNEASEGPNDDESHTDFSTVNDTRLIIHCEDLSKSAQTNSRYIVMPSMHHTLIKICDVKRLLVLQVCLDGKACSIFLASSSTLLPEYIMHRALPSFSSSDRALLLDVIGSMEDLYHQRHATTRYENSQCSSYYKMEEDLVEQLRHRLQATKQASAETHAAFEVLKTSTGISTPSCMEQRTKANQNQRCSREKALSTLERCLEVNGQANAALAADIEHVLHTTLRQFLVC